MTAQTRRGAKTTPELVLIRHAPIATPGRLCGRTDVAARIEPDAIAPLARALADIAHVVSSPALRCRQTAAAIWPARAPDFDGRLWEQNFGAHDGEPFEALPDLGALSPAALATHTPPDGESFADVCARTAPAFADIAERARAAGARVAVVAHAGVIRAALAWAMGAVPAALAFEVATLSQTRLRVAPDGPPWAPCPIIASNVPAP